MDFSTLLTHRKSVRMRHKVHAGIEAEPSTLLFNCKILSLGRACSSEVRPIFHVCASEA